jgi:hypothetical protein
MTKIKHNLKAAHDMHTTYAERIKCLDILNWDNMCS